MKARRLAPVLPPQPLPLTKGEPAGVNSCPQLPRCAPQFPLSSRRGAGGEIVRAHPSSHRSAFSAQRSALTLALIVAPLLLAGCLGARAAGPPLAARGNTLRLAVETDIRTLDPATSTDWDSQPLIRLLYHGLLDYDDQANLIPWLARELPSLSPDGRTLTFHLRPGIRFSNGREVTAEDCVYGIERALDPATKSWGDGFLRGIAGSKAFQEARGKDTALPKGPNGLRPRRAEPRNVSGLRAKDRYTLEIELTAPNPAFPDIMTMTFTYPVPREAVEAAGEDFFRRPVGPGPFVLKEWKRNLRMRLERNPRYTGPYQPHLDAVEILMSADEVVQQMMFERGELAFTPKIPDPDFIRMTTDPKWRDSVVVMPSNEVACFHLNTEMEPFDDRRVRQAMNYAVNKERILRLINGRGIPAYGVVPPAMPGFNPRLRGYHYNPARARALLAQAGYPNGFTVPFWVSSNARTVKLSQALQQDLAEVGVKLEIKTVAANVASPAYRKRRTLPIGYSGWYMDYPDPGNFLDTFLNGERITEDHCLNLAFYNNPKVNALLNRAGREQNRQRRLALYQEAEQRIVDDAPWIFLYFPVRHKLRHPWLRDFSTHPVWPGQYERLRIEPHAT